MVLETLHLSIKIYLNTWPFTTPWVLWTDGGDTCERKALFICFAAPWLAKNTYTSNLTLNQNPLWAGLPSAFLSWFLSISWNSSVCGVIKYFAWGWSPKLKLKIIIALRPLMKWWVPFAMSQAPLLLSAMFTRFDFHAKAVLKPDTFSPRNYRQRKEAFKARTLAPCSKPEICKTRNCNPKAATAAQMTQKCSQIKRFL